MLDAVCRLRSVQSVTVAQQRPVLANSIDVGMGPKPFDKRPRRAQKARAKSREGRFSFQQSLLSRDVYRKHETPMWGPNPSCRQRSRRRGSLSLFSAIPRWAPATRTSGTFGGHYRCPETALPSDFENSQAAFGRAFHKRLLLRAAGVCARSLTAHGAVGINGFLGLVTGLLQPRTVRCSARPEALAAIDREDNTLVSL